MVYFYQILLIKSTHLAILLLFTTTKGQSRVISLSVKGKQSANQLIILSIVYLLSNIKLKPIFTRNQALHTYILSIM